MQRNDQAKKAAKHEKRKQDQEEILKFRDDLVKERRQQLSDDLKQRIEFMEANEELVKGKVENVEKSKLEKQKEKALSHFPFTDGDRVEE